MTDGLHVVLGASGGAGNAITRAAHDAGVSVRAVCRSGTADLPPRVPVVASDITTEEGAAKAVREASVVYMAARPPYWRWPEEFPPMLDRVIEATANADARLVMVDNLYGYGPGAAVVTEDTPERATDRKGAVRRKMTERMLAAHDEGRLRVSIGRASDFFGPRSPNSFVTTLAVEPAARGKAIRWMGSLDAPHSVAYLPDVARAFVALGTSSEGDGSIWMLPHGDPVTGRRFLDLVNAALPEQVKTGVVTKTMLRLAAPLHRMSRETLGVVSQWTEPFVVDDTRFRVVFGPFRTTPLDEAVRATVDWYLRRRA